MPDIAPQIGELHARLMAEEEREEEAEEGS